MAHITTDERLDTLTEVVEALLAAVRQHFNTHNTGGSIVERDAPQLLERIQRAVETAKEQQRC